MNGVMMNANGNGIKVPQERSFSGGAPSRVLVVSGSIGFLGMENAAMVTLEVLDETEPRYHAQGMSLASCNYLQGCGGRISYKRSKSTLVFS